MPGVRSALLIASHIAFAAAFAPTCAPRLPGTFTGLAPNLRSLPALGDVTAPNRAGNARPALSGLTMEHNRVSRRQMGVWGAGIASVLVSAPGRATADVLAAPTSAADIVPASLTTDSWEAAAEKIRAGIGTRKPAVRVPGGGGKTQWTLMRESFRGKWTGPTTWFGKVDPASAVPIDWANPKIVLPKSVYDISFSDDLSGEWRGSGLRFTNKEVVFPLTGPGSAKTTCMFPGGLGMQSSLEYAVAGGKGHPANEVNFFDDRARSMIISLYKTPESGATALESVGVTPFRDANAAIAPGPRTTYPSAEALLSSVKGWKGTQLTRVPDDWGVTKPDLFEGQAPVPVSLDPSRYTSQAVCRAFVDNMIFAGPETITLGKPFEMVYGCKMSDTEFKEVVISYAADGELTSWKHSVYKA